MGPWGVSCSETAPLSGALCTSGPHLFGAVLSSEFPSFLVKIFAIAPPVSWVVVGGGGCVRLIQGENSP